LAEKYGASLAIVFVYAPTARVPVSPEFGVPAPVDNVAQDQDYWRGELEQNPPPNAQNPGPHTLLIGSAAEEILQYAAETRVDLIVMGTHGRTGLKRLLMGSVAEKVLRGAPCSVLVVKMPKPVPAAEKSESAEMLTPAVP